MCLTGACTSADAEGPGPVGSGDDDSGPEGTSGGTGTGDYEDDKHANKSTSAPDGLRRPASELGCIADTSFQYYLSADDSNSMASPARARELLRLGLAPVPSEIRAYEFLNYYDVVLPEGPPGVSLGVELAPGPAGMLGLLLTVQAAPLDAPRPKALTFVVDTSGSMNGESLERAKAALRAMAGALHEGDRVNIVTWDDAQPALEGLEIQGPDDTQLIASIDDLQAGGGSDLEAGLALGYQLATQWHRRDGLNRVVLVSDGGASTSDIDRESIAYYAEDADDRGIYLVGVGVGPADGYDDELMDFVTEAGRGAYVYLDGVAEAEDVFGAGFDEVMEIAARDVQLELGLPDVFEIREFFGEGFSEDATQIEPQHLAPGDAMSFYQTLSSTCDADGFPSEAIIALRVTWIDPLTGDAREHELEKTVGELLGDFSHAALDKAAAVTAYAHALATVDQKRLHAAHQAATVALKTNPEDADLLEITELVALHPAY
jgi:Ca-activated chloride channel family protein